MMTQFLRCSEMIDRLTLQSSISGASSKKGDKKKKEKPAAIIEEGKIDKIQEVSNDENNTSKEE